MKRVRFKSKERIYSFLGISTSTIKTNIMLELKISCLVKNKAVVYPK